MAGFAVERQSGYRFKVSEHLLLELRKPLLLLFRGFQSAGWVGRP